jgi:hypothetical protein
MLAPLDDYAIATGMAPDRLGRDLLLEIEREDREREYGPSDEQLAREALYGARSGAVTPLGTNRHPVDARWRAA